MKKEKSILKILITNCLFLNVVCSGCKEIAFEREIKNWGVYGQQIPLPVQICTADSTIILACESCISLVEEICKHDGVDAAEAGEIVYDAFKQKLPVHVSLAYYQEALQNRIIVVPRIDSIYRNEGIKGIIENCFQWKGESWCLDEISYIPEYKSNRWSKSETDYIIYLLSLHKIYMTYLISDEVPIITFVLADRISNMP